MSNIFFISDTHFNHANILTFLNDEGARIRPEFNNVEEMNEHIIRQWNSVVTPQDKIYHLGDVIMGDRSRLKNIMPRLNGKKRLLLGNHDTLKGSDLACWFQKVELWRIFKNERFICTHVPIHSDCFRAKCLVNVHGHIHQNDMNDPRYLNVCVEKTSYTPVSMDQILDKIKDVT